MTECSIKCLLTTTICVIQMRKHLLIETRLMLQNINFNIRKKKPKKQKTKKQNKNKNKNYNFYV